MTPQQMKELPLNFWERLEMFISNVEVNDPMSEEEKQMIISVCKSPTIEINRWIPVSERLPEDSEIVIGCNNESKNPDDYWCLGVYYDVEYKKWFNQFEFHGFDWSIIVTHWQPLPPKPTK